MSNEFEKERIQAIKSIEEKLTSYIQQKENLDEIKPIPEGGKEKLIDIYHEILNEIKRLKLEYNLLNDISKRSYDEKIIKIESDEINYFSNYLSLYQEIYGLEKIYFVFYLQLNNLIFKNINKIRNLTIHGVIDKTPEEFYFETYPDKINEMVLNLDKTIKYVDFEIEKFNKERNIRQLLYHYEILGDLRIQKIALLKYYSRNKKIEYIKEAELTLKAYNKALSYRNKMRLDNAILSPRIRDYMVIFEDFFYFDARNKGNLLTLDLKHKFIQEKFKIWEKSLPELKFSTDPVKGMIDYYPSDLREANWIIETIRDVVERYSFEEYATPQLEPIEIFAAKSSDELVNEQSFFIEKKEDEKLILIPELTPSLARMVAKKSQILKKPIRWFSIPTCYRYERPQRGRRREFKQPNVDILGEVSLYADLEIFNIIIDIFTEFGATAEQFQIYYNSRRFMDAVSNLILRIEKDKTPLVYKALDKSDKMNEEEYEKYLIDLFQDEVIIQGIFKLKDAKSVDELLGKLDDIPEEFYQSEGYLELTKFERLIKEVDISNYCTFSSGTVRGLDYYTGIIYEVFDTGKENIRSIFGGGRYDDLLSIFSDEKITGTGFGMGVYMLSLFLKTYNLIPDEIKEKDYSDTIYIASINEDMSTYAFELARIIKDEDFPCIIDYRFKNLKNQLKKANELGVIIVLIIGSEELTDRTVTIRNMVSEEQKTVDLDELIDEIYNIIDQFGDNKHDQ